MSPDLHDDTHTQAFNGASRQQQAATTTSPSQANGTDPVSTDAPAREDTYRRQVFRYHLHHLNPPSLVPITIQQANVSGESQRRPLGAGARAASDAAGQLDDQMTGGSESRLFQLQLPLQLHLKLKPLALPMPPPAQPTSGGRPDGKRRRSLAVPATGPPEVRAGPGSAPGEHLNALSWQEAKRVLVLNSMGPALVQAARLERRMAARDEPAETPDLGAPTTTGRPGSLAAAPTTTSAQVLAGTVTNAASRQLASAAPPGGGGGGGETPTTTMLPTATEVRRQRHSAQQVSRIFLVFSCC